jgi:P4 family phage/plasmid primase-like protien
LGPDVFFVPCEWGTKKPMVTYVERPFASTQSEAYRAMFVPGQTNIAVYLGKASGGLCAIDFDADSDLEAFQALNPLLAQTTRSRGSRGGMVWLRIAGEYPESCNPDHKHFEWRADNRLSTISGRHPKGMDYTLVCDKPPVTVAFADIVWPLDWVLPWVLNAGQQALKNLEQAYGRPFYTNKDGKVTGINERFWAGLYSRENTVLFDPDDRCFYLYHGENGLWRPITAEAIRETISSRILEVSRESEAWTLEIQITQTKLNAIVSALKGIVERRGVFRERKSFIHVGNGVIRFGNNNDVEFGAFSPEDFSRNQSPLHFDPQAECPRFLNELILPAVTAEDADLLQRWAGLAIFGYNLPQRFLILDGMPNGGKGTLVRIIQALVGGENCCQLRTDQLAERFEMFRFRSKTLLIGPDVAGNFLMQKGASMLKVLVGGDPISAEAKSSNGDFQLYGTFNVVMTCNSRLRIRLEEDAGAWRRRLLIVRYEKPPVTKRILDFDKLLLASEGAGILRWALAGFVRLREQFTSIGDFALSEAQTARIDSLLNESESLRVFVREGLEAAPGDDVTSAEIVSAYAEFCADRGWNPMPVTIIERQLTDLMLETFKVSKSNDIEREGNKRGWHGVRLKPVVPADPVSAPDSESLQDPPDHPFACPEE